MLRLVEILLFLLPFAVFVAWRVLAPAGGPSPRVVAIAVCAVLALIGVLIWFGHYDTIPRGDSYVPAQLQGGRVIPGHGAAR